MIISDTGPGGEQQGEPGTTVGGELPEGAVPVTAEWYYRDFGITKAQYTTIKYAVLIVALMQVVK